MLLGFLQVIRGAVRRTRATMMQALGNSLELVNRCQDHALPGSKVLPTLHAARLCG
jgi:hypothetical protein